MGDERRNDIREEQPEARGAPLQKPLALPHLFSSHRFYTQRSLWGLMGTLEAAVGRALQGDPNAFGEIVEATSARLVRLSARMVGNLADAEDVVQESYVKAYRALSSGSFDGRSSVETWLYRIVTNASIDALRGRARRPAASDEMGELPWDGQQSLDAQFALKEIEEWLGDLPPEQRVALTLKAIEGFSAAETAEIMGCSEGAVEQRLVRARAALRQKDKSND